MTATETVQTSSPARCEFGKCVRELQTVETASGSVLSSFWTSEKDDKVQTAIILNCAGPHVLDVYDTFIWTDDGDKDKPDRVLEALERYCNPRDNEVIESHRF